MKQLEEMSEIDKMLVRKFKIFYVLCRGIASSLELLSLLELTSSLALFLISASPLLNAGPMLRS